MLIFCFLIQLISVVAFAGSVCSRWILCACVWRMHFHFPFAQFDSDGEKRFLEYVNSCEFNVNSALFQSINPLSIEFKLMGFWRVQRFVSVLTLTDYKHGKLEMHQIYTFQTEQITRIRKIAELDKRYFGINYYAWIRISVLCSIWKELAEIGRRFCRQIYTVRYFNKKCRLRQLFVKFHQITNEDGDKNHSLCRYIVLFSSNSPSKSKNQRFLQWNKIWQKNFLRVKNLPIHVQRQETYTLKLWIPIRKAKEDN